MISPFEFKTTRILAVAFLLIVATGVYQANSFAQMAADESNASTTKADSEAAYKAALAKGRKLAKECRNVSLRFFDSSFRDSHQWKKQWPEARQALADHQLVLEQATIDWFLDCNKPDEDLLRIASAVSAQLYDRGDLETAWDVLSKIHEFYPEDDDIMLLRRMALVAIKTNQFDFALGFLQKSGAKEAVNKLEGQLDKNMFMICPLLAAKWRREKDLREKEAQADDLPRVKLQLSTGEVIVELFENEAPETVANFINLVESGYYDDSFCSPHVKDIVVQSGAYNRSHNVPIDYVIKNESRKSDARDHFVGSLSMASFEGGEESSAVVFAVTLIPNPDLDWNRKEDDTISQPVFGRVVSGMKHVRALPVTMEVDEETQEEKPIKGITPGHIEKATVIRKREHEYTFEKIRRQKE